ncbi:MAG: hypothetical protein ACI9DF_001327 [Verrucomicrobiales bacterium]|jgi:hypothetical protein
MMRPIRVPDEALLGLDFNGSIGFQPVINREAPEAIIELWHSPRLL